jgi:hypothetical protein
MAIGVGMAEDGAVLARVCLREIRLSLATCCLTDVCALIVVL